MYIYVPRICTGTWKSGVHGSFWIGVYVCKGKLLGSNSVFRLKNILVLECRQYKPWLYTNGHVLASMHLNFVNAPSELHFMTVTPISTLYATVAHVMSTMYSFYHKADTILDRISYSLICRYVCTCMYMLFICYNKCIDLYSFLAVYNEKAQGWWQSLVYMLLIVSWSHRWDGYNPKGSEASHHYI